VTVPVGAKVLPLVRVKAPSTEKSAEGWAVGVSFIVNPAKLSNVPVVPILQPVPLIVMVPPVGWKVWLAEIFKAPVMEKEVLYWAWEVGVTAIVSPEKVREVPELEIPEPTALMVIVPLEGLKVAVEELVKVPAMLNEEEVVTVAPEAMVKP
jgi:hypothetical protein